MRALDVGAAVGYALLCLAVLIFVNPYASEAGRAQVRVDWKAYAAASGLVRARGLLFLHSATVEEVCSAMASASNSSVILGGSVDGISCSPPPPTRYLADSTLELDLGGRRVVIEAWVVEG